MPPGERLRKRGGGGPPGSHVEAQFQAGVLRVAPTGPAARLGHLLPRPARCRHPGSAHIPRHRSLETASRESGRCGLLAQKSGSSTDTTRGPRGAGLADCSHTSHRRGRPLGPAPPYSRVWFCLLSPEVLPTLVFQVLTLGGSL